MHRRKATEHGPTKLSLFCLSYHSQHHSAASPVSSRWSKLCQLSQDARSKLEVCIEHAKFQWGPAGCIPNVHKVSADLCMQEPSKIHPIGWSGQPAWKITAKLLSEVCAANRFIGGQVDLAHSFQPLIAQMVIAFVISMSCVLGELAVSRLPMQSVASRTLAPN